MTEMGKKCTDSSSKARARPALWRGSWQCRWRCSLVELWLEWLHDEISMAVDGLDREHVYDLFEKAVKDYICEFPVKKQAPGKLGSNPELAALFS